MGQINSREKETERQLEEEGIRFSSSNRKSIRLFFQSQFTMEMEDEDFTYLNHIFELKVFLYFRQHYDRGHLLNTKRFLEEVFERNIETMFSDIKQLEIMEVRNDEYEGQSESEELLSQYFQFKKKKLMEAEFNDCIVNKFLSNLKENVIPPVLELSEDFISKLRTTRELEIYALLNDNTNIIYFVVKRLIEKYAKSLRKITIYQVGLKTVDEMMYTVLASYLRYNPLVDSVCIIEKTPKKNIQFDYECTDGDERLENPIINRQHLFNFYQSLSARTNLLELRVLFFIKDYNFVLLSHVIFTNKNLRVLQVRNVSERDSESKGRELDFTFFELNEMGENLRDEIFIFFNYLTQLEHIEQIHLTNFWFNSEINFLACDCAKNLRHLKVLSLEYNQAVINNDATVLECYNIEQTTLESLNLGYSYLNMIRRFDYIIHPDRLKQVNIGILDFVSFSSFLKYLPNTSLERVTVFLNKPVSIDSIPFIFEQIADHPFRAANLKFLYIFNLYSFHTYSAFNKVFNMHLFRLIEKMKMNSSIRKLSFKKPCMQYTSVKETEEEFRSGFRTFRYINKRDYNMVASVILVLKKLFNVDKVNQRGIQNDFFFNCIIKNIVHFRFADYRKIVLE